MPLLRDRDGTWSIRIDSESEKVGLEKFHASYLEALPRYATLFDLAFRRAKERSEFAFISTLLRVRGHRDAGWDPYESSLQAIGQMRTVHAKTESPEAARHLELWIYGHIVEASEPYEILANLIDISLGDTFKTACFPPENGRPQSPGKKIKELEKAAKTANLPDFATPLKEVWDRDLRNSIFHSDYSVHGPEVRFVKDGFSHAYGHEKILTLINRTLAYFDVLRNLLTLYTRGYTEPIEIAVHPLNAAVPEERAMVMVREGHGVIGLKSAWTPEELKQGYIDWRFGRFSREESGLASADPTRAFFPNKESPPDESASS